MTTRIVNDEAVKLAIETLAIRAPVDVNRMRDALEAVMPMVFSGEYDLLKRVADAEARVEALTNALKAGIPCEDDGQHIPIRVESGMPFEAMTWIDLPETHRVVPVSVLAQMNARLKAEGLEADRRSEIRPTRERRRRAAQPC